MNKITFGLHLSLGAYALRISSRTAPNMKWFLKINDSFCEIREDKVPTEIKTKLIWIAAGLANECEKGLE